MGQIDKEMQIKRCSHEGCTNHEKKGRVCIGHGAKVKKGANRKDVTTILLREEYVL